MTASIMAYAPGAHVPVTSTGLLVPDWVNNRMFNSEQGGSEGITGFVGYISGDVYAAKTIADLGIAGISDFPMCYTANGNLFVPTGSGSNSVGLAQIRAVDLSLISIGFTPSSQTGPSNSTSLLSPDSLVPLHVGRSDWVIATPFSLHKGEIAAISVPGMGLANLGNLTENTFAALLGPGKSTNTLGTAYALGLGTNTFSVYKISASGLLAPTLSAALHTFVPSGIDATWSTFSNVNGIVYDSTDDNIIIGVTTNDSVTNKSYICKLSGTTGALIWATACPYATGSSTNRYMRNSIIKNGRYRIFSDGGPFLHTFTTSTGALVTSSALTQLGNADAGTSEDISDSIIVATGWSDAAPEPNFIGTYMGTLGNHSYNGWVRYWPAGPTGPWPVPPTGVTSINRTWSYTLDGHTFYVLDLGSEGTFVYDKVTNKWAQFVTGAPTMDGSSSPQWNMQNGCMWGQRIVAGDLNTPNVWEMTPASTLDNDVTPITHVSTAGLDKRDRAYSSVESVRVAGSIGLLDSAGTVTFNLRFSDDNGNTWSSFFSVTLTPGNFGDEVAWRSLGSFAAPGRIFELYDTGGLIRIDGADIFLDNFDDVPQQGG